MQRTSILAVRRTANFLESFQEFGEQFGEPSYYYQGPHLPNCCPGAKIFYAPKNREIAVKCRDENPNVDAIVMSVVMIV